MWIASSIDGAIAGPQGALIAGSADMYNEQVHSVAEREVRRLIRQEYFEDVDPAQVLQLMTLLAENGHKHTRSLDPAQLENFDPVTIAFYNRYSGLGDLIVTDYDQNRGMVIGATNGVNPIPFTSIEYENDRQREVGEAVEEGMFYITLAIGATAVVKLGRELLEEVPRFAGKLKQTLDDMLPRWGDDVADDVGRGVGERVPNSGARPGAAGKDDVGSGVGTERNVESINNPVSGSPRIGSATKVPDGQHGFNDIVDNYAAHAYTFDIPTKGLGGEVVRTSKLYQIEGSNNGKMGVFEWIVDNGNITHRRFIPNGKVTGTPNQVPKK